MSEIWVLGEIEKDQVKEVSLELLSEARELAEKRSWQVVGIFPCENPVEKIETLGDYGANEVVCLLHEGFPHAQPEGLSSVLFELLAQRSPRMILSSTASAGRDMAVRLAVKARIPLISDARIIQISRDGSKIEVTKPTYEKKVFTRFECPEQKSVVITFQQGILGVEKVRNPVPARITTHRAEWPENCNRLKYIERFKADPRTLGVEDAEIIVAGGLGTGGKRTFDLVGELAWTLGGALAGSRPACDAQWVEKNRQIGASGKSVKPRLYVACGISGAIHHTIGMRESEVIVSINKDANASMTKLADLKVKGDLQEILPHLVDEINKRKAEKATT